MEVLVLDAYNLEIKDNGTCIDASVVDDSTSLQYSTFSILGKLDCEFHNIITYYDEETQDGHYKCYLIIEYEYKDGITSVKCLPMLELVNFDSINLENSFYYGYGTNTSLDRGIENCLELIINSVVAKNMALDFNNDNICNIDNNRLIYNLTTKTQENMTVHFGDIVNPYDVIEEVAKQFNIIVDFRLKFNTETKQFDYEITIGKVSTETTLNDDYVLDLKKSEDKNHRTNVLYLWPKLNYASEDYENDETLVIGFIFALLKDGTVRYFRSATSQSLNDIPTNLRITPVIKEIITYDNSKFDDETTLEEYCLTVAQNEFKVTLENTTFSFSYPQKESEIFSLGETLKFNYEDTAYSVSVTQVKKTYTANKQDTMLVKYKCGLSRTSLTDKLNQDGSSSSSKGSSTSSSGISKESDPTVPVWAKQPNKPTYTASEVGALSTKGGGLTGDVVSNRKIEANILAATSFKPSENSSDKRYIHFETTESDGSIRKFNITSSSKVGSAADGDSFDLYEMKNKFNLHSHGCYLNLHIRGYASQLASFDLMIPIYLPIGVGGFATEPPTGYSGFSKFEGSQADFATILQQNFYLPNNKEDEATFIPMEFPCSGSIYDLSGRLAHPNTYAYPVTRVIITLSGDGVNPRFSLKVWDIVSSEIEFIIDVNANTNFSLFQGLIYNLGTPNNEL